MENSNITYLQEFVNKEFNKILPLKLEENTFNIMIRKDHIPKIISLDKFDDHSIISFTKKPKEYLNFEKYIALSEDGEIEAIQLTKSDDFYSVINSRLNEIERGYPEKSREEKLFKHRQLRLIYAIKEMIKNMPII
jgi:hypothetical protein